MSSIMVKHELFSSASLSSLEARFFEEVKKDKARDPLSPVVVLVGSFHLGRYLARELAKKGRGLLNFRFVTIHELAKSLSRSAPGGEARTELPDLIEDALLDEVIASVKLSYFEPVKKYAGFKKALAATFHDLRDAGFKDRIKNLADKKLGPDLNRDKLLETARLASAFFKSYQREFYDDYDLIAEAAKNAAGFGERFLTSRLHVYGIYDFTKSQAELLRALARELELKVYLPYANHPAFAFAKKGFDFYSSLLKVKAETLPAQFGGDGALSRVQAAVAVEAGEDQKPPVDNSGVEIVAAPGAVREVEEIAGRILRFAEAGMKFHEMAVLVRDSELYLPLIREVFDRAGILIHAPGLDTLDRTSQGQCALRLVELIPEGRAREFLRRELIELLSGPDLKLPGAEDDKWLVSRWNDFTVEAGVVAGREDWDNKLKALARRSENKDDKKRIENFHEFSLGLIDELLAFSGKSSFSEMGEALQKLCLELGLSLPLEELQLEFIDLDRLRVSASVSGFKDLVRDWLASVKADADSQKFQQGAVTVGSIMELRLARFRAVFAPGMQNRSFPAPAREDPILLDRERKELNRLFNEPNAIPLKSLRPIEERLLFNMIVQSALEKLVLSYSRTDEQGRKERLPSPFLLTVGSAVAGQSVNYSMMAEGRAGMTWVPFSRARILKLRPESPDDRPALDFEEALVWAFARGEFDRDHLPAKLAEGRPFLARGLNAIAMRTRRASGPYLGRLTGAEAQSELKNIFCDKIFSNSQLEKYAKCPFSYFCDKLMQLEQPDLPEEAEFGTLEKGNLVHAALHAFMERLQKKKMLPLARQDDDRLLKLLEKEFEDCLASEKYEVFRGTLDWRFEKENLKQELPTLLASLKKCEQEGFSPAAFELGFGFGDKTRGLAYSHPEPIPLELPDGEVIRLRGQIDRLDRSEAGALRLIDYKTSNQAVRLDDLVRGGTALQRPLYLIAAGKITGREIDELADSEAGYVYVMGKGERMIAGEKDNLGRALSVIAAIVRGMKAGMFAPLAVAVKTKNREYVLCDGYCNFKELCGSGRKSLRERLSEDDPARRLREELDGYE